ncbi:MAG: hypothetical protein EOM54_10470 [Clostridia bacterium]|nr:hypothetical protein [Clostridia bacterium]NCC68937.1 hypothetical protein [Clostridia bacterium]
MTDRVPINILTNGAIKQNVYDAAGNLLRTEYVKRDDGATVTGTALNKANILDDTVAAAIEAYTGVTLPSDPTINDVFEALSQLTSVQVSAGTYVGTGTYGSSHKNSLTFDFTPKWIFVKWRNSPDHYQFKLLWGLTSTQMRQMYNSSTYTIYVSYSSNTVYWYEPTTQYTQLNDNGAYYDYLAIG